MMELQHECSALCFERSTESGMFHKNFDVCNDPMEMAALKSKLKQAGFLTFIIKVDLEILVSIYIYVSVYIISDRCDIHDDNLWKTIMHCCFWYGSHQFTLVLSLILVWLLHQMIYDFTKLRNAGIYLACILLSIFCSFFSGKWIKRNKKSGR